MAVTAGLLTREAGIEAYLRDECTIQVAQGCAKGTGMTAVHNCIFSSQKKVPKESMIKKLVEFYANAQNIIDIWDKLSPCERDFISYIVRYGGNEYPDTTIAYAKKYNLPLKYENGWGYFENIMTRSMTYLKFLHILTENIAGTKTVVFFPSGKAMAPFVLEVLQKVVKPDKFTPKEYVPEKGDRVIRRENRIGDFGALVSLSMGERLKVKLGTYDLTKAKLAKISEIIGFEEVCEREGMFCTPKEVKGKNGFKVAQPLFVLAANSGLLDIDSSGMALPGKKASELLSLPADELVKRMFNGYCKDAHICEVCYIDHLRVQNNLWVNWGACRGSIIAMLKNCPVEQFINFNDFDMYVRLSCGNFLTKVTKINSISVKRDCGHYSYYDSEPNWDECEAPIICMILTFLSALGMVDIAYMEDVDSSPEKDVSRDDAGFMDFLFEDDTYEADNYLRIAGFRINRLGAWVLGMKDVYEVTEKAAETTGTLKKDEGGFVVLPDYSVVISGLRCRVEHEIFLSKFLTKVSVDENAAVYKLDFKSMIRAYNFDITPHKIKERLIQASDQALPDNVARTLDDWQTRVGRIKIRTLTLLETDDALLLEEIKHIKGMGEIITDDLHHVVAIDSDKQKKVKTLVERNGWLVECK